MPPAARIRPYKDFLTPALHRRFALATSTLFALCYVEAFLIGEKNSCKLRHSHAEISLTSCRFLVVVSSGKSWNSKSSSVHTIILHLHPSSWAASCWHTHIIFRLGYFHKICHTASSPPDHRLVSRLRMVLQRSVPLVSINRSRFGKG